MTRRNGGQVCRFFGGVGARHRPGHLSRGAGAVTVWGRASPRFPRTGCPLPELPWLRAFARVDWRVSKPADPAGHRPRGETPEGVATLTGVHVLPHGYGCDPLPVGTAQQANPTAHSRSGQARVRRTDYCEETTPPETLRLRAACTCDRGGFQVDPTASRDSCSVRRGLGTRETSMARRVATPGQHQPRG